MERALFLNRMREPLPDGISRLYFGSEFCPWTFPGREAIEKALDAARQAGCGFTLATPVLSEPFLPVLRSTLETILPLLEKGDEVLVSDLGGIETVRQIAPEIPLLIGRVLSGQKRGPRILDLELGEEQQEYFRQGSWYSAEAASLLQELAIDRVELDNLLQGVAPLPDTLRGSLHYPFAMVTSSRNCPYRKDFGGGPCPAPCGEIFTLTTPQSAVPLLQGGNTQFLRNDRLPDRLSALGIDRLVHHPELPR